ncbi:hypothetical protein ACFSQE_00695 [Vogesella fluminis]|uniref:Uncharacterized protein n=1 Tax=Vogesella fluminis TaxID=1069161 RepID=A0ABQ3HC25_9NEIS|nr:hypothetical protein [Vogesella fluminis]GHD81457.1 hypothetical protein GCM10011419_27400 [Vogesella fluminis]
MMLRKRLNALEAARNARNEVLPAIIIRQGDDEAALVSAWRNKYGQREPGIVRIVVVSARKQQV